MICKIKHHFYVDNISQTFVIVSSKSPFQVCSYINSLLQIVDDTDFNWGNEAGFDWIWTSCLKSGVKEHFVRCWVLFMQKIKTCAVHQFKASVCDCPWNVTSFTFYDLGMRPSNRLNYTLPLWSWDWSYSFISQICLPFLSRLEGNYILIGKLRSDALSE